MNLPKHPTLLRRMRDARVKQLCPRCPPLAASLGRQAGGRHHVTIKQRGKTRTVYVPQALLPEVRTWRAEHKRLKALLPETHQLSLALLRARARLLKLKAGRP